MYKPYGAFSEHFIKVNETRIPEAYARREAVMISVFYGLLLYMGIDLFMSEGLFRGLKLLFMDRSLYLDDYQNKVWAMQSE